MLAVTAALWAALLFGPTLRAVTDVDTTVLRVVAHTRTAALTSVMRAVDHVGSAAVVRVVAWATIAALLACRRFPHLIAYLAALLAVSVIETVVAVHVARIRPVGVAILAPWSGYAHPSRPVAGVAVLLVGAVHTLVPAPWRRRAAVTSAVALACLGLARLYLAVDHPTDVLAGVALGWAVPALLYAFATPDESFPVTYGYRPRAHLDIGGARGQAIRGALDQQLGIHVTSVEPFGLGGSAGSTPLLITGRRRERDEEVAVFAKLYARNHVRSDRLYKLARSIRYGRLEDELPFSSVRRLAEYEDHLLRLFRDLGLPTPEPYGLVEISPEREYLLVMEFFAGAAELGDAPLGEGEIDQGLAIVRTMWDAGVAHRDIKPSNLLVRDGGVVLIDVAFAAVRPTPWRQAVDLANMMLTLALVSSAEQVYRRALRVFTPDDIAEAFAASRGVTVPAQLKARLHADGRRLDDAFRALAPTRAPVAVQRWTVRRVTSTIGVAAVITGAVWAASVYARSAGLL
ncbi:MAG TPA: phosphatase PAP2 family protein [Acidimicrobiales bacterium]|nr:phosphatase PAP2 family protein [Acidimicrobiales bacterium]